ncbi:hypothetical protein LY76DRAFT_136015 [Colletotrichum caudatum]|nr:hypothetical protein LY76DRAFT_136015 [Colletotrichum caudatum]
MVESRGSRTHSNVPIAQCTASGRIRRYLTLHYTTLPLLPAAGCTTSYSVWGLIDNSGSKPLAHRIHQSPPSRRFGPRNDKLIHDLFPESAIHLQKDRRLPPWTLSPTTLIDGCLCVPNSGRGSDSQCVRVCVCTGTK